MTRLHQQIETRLPLDAAFAFVADFANATRWDPGVATSEPVDDRPVGLGARYRLGVRMRGRVTPMEYWITEFDAPRRVVLTGTGPGVSAVDEIRFEPPGRSPGSTTRQISGSAVCSGSLAASARRSP